MDKHHLAHYVIAAVIAVFVIGVIVHLVTHPIGAFGG